MGLLDDIYCRSARGAVGGTPVPRVRGEELKQKVLVGGKGAKYY